MRFEEDREGEGGVEPLAGLELVHLLGLQEPGGGVEGLELLQEPQRLDALDRVDPAPDLALPHEALPHERRDQRVVQVRVPHVVVHDLAVYQLPRARRLVRVDRPRETSMDSP